MESRKGRIVIGRRAGRIGFMGRGVGVPSREMSDVAHALSLRIGEDLIAEADSERDRCRDDAAPHPGLLRSVFSRRPRVVVFPDSGQCVADILDVCIEERTPAVPRGGGSAGLGGAVPVRGGVAIDLSRMDKVLSLDKAQGKVTVEPGCTWRKLREEIASADLSLRSYPSNIAGGTVGGWISTGGYGVGTLVDGRFHAKVESMEVAVPSGLLVSASHGKGRYSIESFAGTEGQLGIVTRLTFPLKPKPERSAHFLVVAKRVEDAVAVLRDLAVLDSPPVGIRLVSGKYPALLGGTACSAGAKGPVIAVLFEGGEGVLGRLEEEIKKSAGRLRLEVARGEEARTVFETQFTDLAGRLKRVVVRSGEVLIGLDRLAELMGILEKASDGEVLLEAQVVDRGLAVVMTCYFQDKPGLPPVIRDVPSTVRISRVAIQCGGRPYGIGLWNSPFAKSVLEGRRKALEVIKSETDRLRILNPGKFFSLTTGSGLPVWGWTYRVGLRMIESL